MTCKHCAMAQTTAHVPTYQRDCYGCQKRAAALSPQFHAAMKARDMELPKYVEMMERVFGDDWRQVHEEVKADYRRIKALQAKRSEP